MVFPLLVLGGGGEGRTLAPLTRPATFRVGCTIRKLAELKRSWKNMMEAEKPLQNKGFQLPFLF